MSAFPILLICATLSAIDGDSIRCNGENMRMMVENTPHTAGYDTPETGGRPGPQCIAERMLGRVATRRLEKLITTEGVEVWDSGERDGRYQRPLVWAVMPDGIHVGQIMLDEGLARPWAPNTAATWCEPLR